MNKKLYPQTYLSRNNRIKNKHRSLNNERKPVGLPVHILFRASNTQCCVDSPHVFPRDGRTLLPEIPAASRLYRHLSNSCSHIVKLRH